MGITHAFTSAKVDGSDASLVKPSDWNASHVIGDGTMTLNAASSVGTFTLTSGALVALTLGDTPAIVGALGHVFDFGSTAAPGLVLTTASGGTGGPDLYLYHNSATPAASDTVGSIYFSGRDSAANLQSYGRIVSTIIDPTSASEDSSLDFRVISGGAVGLLTALTLGTTVSADAVFGHQFNFGTTDYATLELVSTSSGVGGAQIGFFQDSASPLASDDIANFSFSGRDSASNIQQYGSMAWQIGDPTSGSEDSDVRLAVYSGGSSLTALTLGTTDTLGSYAHVLNFGSADAGSLTVQNSAATSGGPVVIIFHDSASPAAADVPGGVFMYGRDSAANAQQYGRFVAKIDDTTSGSEDSHMEFTTPVAGTTANRLAIGGGVYHESATGTDKGNNTTNFSNQYDDGTLLITCYVDEAARTGKVDLAFWDGLVDGARAEGCSVAPDAINAPPSKHYGAHKFAARLGTEYDPTTLAGQRKHVTDKQHLTPYQNRANFSEETRPSLGSWIQRGVEMDELLFLYITQLEDRIAALEAATVH